MILSASRRTDIPCFYSQWFTDRLREGRILVRNPFRHSQVTAYPLSPENVDCIVFWTKNPIPMLGRLHALEPYPYYFQFTLTGYGRDIEPGLPDKRESLIPAFCALSRQLGPQRVIWRYDPVFFTPRYTPEYHARAFEKIASALEGYTVRAVFSFLDMYRGIEERMRRLGRREAEREELLGLCRAFGESARAHGMSLETCAEDMELSGFGISRGRCVDRELIEGLLGCRLKGGKDRNQRAACGCMESVDIGAYGTCGSGCAYCYAGGSRRGMALDKKEPLLGGPLGPEDEVREKKLPSLREDQLGLFDLPGAFCLQKEGQRREKGLREGRGEAKHGAEGAV